MKDIDDVLDELQTVHHMELEKEDEVAGFLGVHIQRDINKNEVTLTQVGLIDRIIEALQIDDLGPAVDTPADDVLGKDPDGDTPDYAFNYPSMIGMLWYVEAHTRPDLRFALSQAACFAFSPK